MEDDIEIVEDIGEDKICKRIDKSLCGEIVDRRKDYASVKFIPIDKMIIDDNMLVHYGFVFSSASYCAMSAVNQPNSIIIYAETKFLSPVELGSEVIFKAEVLQSDLKKREVTVTGFVYNIKMFEAVFHIVTFEQNIFKINFENLDK